MDDSSTATTPSPSPAAATAAGYDAARDKTTTTTAGSSAAGSNAGSGSGVSSIRLLIKSSNQQYDDMNIESDLCWTVERLKKQLSMVYPGKPEIKDQKLIYSGKLVNDTQKLSEVIRSYKDVYQQHHIFHLVCVNRSLTKPPYKAMTTPAKDNGVNANTNTNATANANVNATPRLETNNTNDNELRQRHVSTTAAAAAAAQIPYQQLQQQPQQQQQQQQQYPWMQHLTDPNMQNHAYHLAAYQAAAAAAYGAVNVSTMTHLTQEQQQALLTNAWIQHCYAQYMQQVMQRPSGAQNAGPALPMLHPLLQNMPVIPHMMSVPQADPAAVPAAAQAANEAAAAGLQPAAAAAAGRQVDGPNFVNIQEEPEMRDWLDSFFSFTRLAIFATVLYFNSSPMRCLLVLLIASGIYLYHIGILRRRRERNNNNINRNNNAGNDAAAFAAVQQIQRMMDAAVERDNNPQAAAEPAPVAPAGQDADEAAAARPAAASAAGGADQADAAEAAAVAAAVVEPANANNSVISIVRTFVITFFTSLLPEAPAL